MLHVHYLIKELIGLIIPTVSNPFFGELTFYIETICNSIGYKVLICNSLNNIENEKKYLEMLMRNQVDGIIVGTHNQGILDYKNDNLAVVSIDTYLSENIPIIFSIVSQMRSKIKEMGY